MATICLVISPEQHLESEGLDPEPLRCPQVMTGPGNTQMTRRKGFTAPSLLNLSAWSSAWPRLPEEPAGSGLLYQDGAGIEQIEALTLHVLLRFGPRLSRGDGDVAAGRRRIGEPGREQRGLDAPAPVGGRGRGDPVHGISWRHGTIL